MIWKKFEAPKKVATYLDNQNPEGIKKGKSELLTEEEETRFIPPRGLGRYQLQILLYFVLFCSKNNIKRGGHLDRNQKHKNK